MKVGIAGCSVSPVAVILRLEAMKIYLLATILNINDLCMPFSMFVCS